MQSTDLKTVTRYFLTRIFTVCIPHKILLGVQIKIMRWAGLVARIGEWEMRTRFWWGTTKERPLRRPRRRWSLNIKIDIQGGVLCYGKIWFGSG